MQKIFNKKVGRKTHFFLAFYAFPGIFSLGIFLMEKYYVVKEGFKKKASNKNYKI